MKNSIYTTAAGMLTSAERLNIISNNLANVDTSGYKNDIPFEQTIRFLAEGPLPGKEQPVIGGTALRMQQGVITSTGRKLDLAVEGAGFFAVQGPGNQTLYTRNGAFNLNSNRELVTSDGYNVLDKFGKKITIYGEDMQLTSRGEIMIDGNYYTTLKVVDLSNRDNIEKVGNTYFKLKPNINEPIPLNIPSLIVGSLEKSNVNLMEGMGELINTSRSFELQKTAADVMFKIIRKTITDVPKPI